MVTLAGAMSTAELGISLSEMIRNDFIHSVSCTGANLEEDIFNLVAHNEYKRIPEWRDLTPAQESQLLEEKYARVTDTCIPEDSAMRKVEGRLLKVWQDAESKGERLFPHQAMIRLIKSGALKEFYQIDPKDSWLCAAAEKNTPIFVPGWEDSTLGNNFVARVAREDIKSLSTAKTGLDYMKDLASWYQEVTKDSGIGFFQVGGGIAGDFPICVVPMIQYDLKKDARLWTYFCQISDSTTSYGSYSGAVPNEKITWGKLDESSPKFIIESDATIVAPLIFQYIIEEMSA